MFMNTGSSITLMTKRTRIDQCATASPRPLRSLTLKFNALEMTCSSLRTYSARASGDDQAERAIERRLGAQVSVPLVPQATREVGA